MSAPPAPRACRRWRVIGLHALRNALIPVVTVIGLLVGTAVRRRHPDRDHLRLARRRQMAGRFDRPARLPVGPGRGRADRQHRHAGQSRRRPALRPHQPAHPARELSHGRRAAARRAAAGQPAAVAAGRVLVLFPREQRRRRRPRRHRRSWSWRRSSPTAGRPARPGRAVPRRTSCAAGLGRGRLLVASRSAPTRSAATSSRASSTAPASRC